MFRALGAVLAFSLAAPTSALACGMYMPPTKHEATLADVLDSIDEVVKPADEKPAAVANAEVDPVPAETASATLPADENTSRSKRHKPQS